MKVLAVFWGTLYEYILESGVWARIEWDRYKLEHENLKYVQMLNNVWECFRN